MIRIMDGKRPSRPPKGEDLGLSDELWGIIQSLLAHEAVGRPSVSLLVDVLEKATLKTFMLEELAEFDVNSEEHIQKLRRVLECGDNTFLEVQENETLVLIEVFDRVGPLARHFFAPQTFLTWSGFRFSTPRWMTPRFATNVYTDFRKLPPGVVFCQRATGSPIPVSPNLTMLLWPQEGYPAPAGGWWTEIWLPLRPSLRTASITSMPSSMYVSPLSKTSPTDTIFYSGAHRDCVPMRSCGGDYDIQMWSVSLDLAPITFHSPLYIIGCPMGPCPSICVSTPMSINSVWYVATSVRFSTLNSPDPPTIPVIGRRPRVDLPTSV